MPQRRAVQIQGAHTSSSERGRKTRAPLELSEVGLVRGKAWTRVVLLSFALFLNASITGL